MRQTRVTNKGQIGLEQRAKNLFYHTVGEQLVNWWWNLFLWVIAKSGHSYNISQNVLAQFVPQTLPSWSLFVMITYGCCLHLCKAWICSLWFMALCKHANIFHVMLFICDINCLLVKWKDGVAKPLCCYHFESFKLHFILILYVVPPEKSVVLAL